MSNRLGAGPKIPPWEGGVANATETRQCPHKCYQTKFRRCRSNHLVVGRVPKILGTLGPRPLGTTAWLIP